MKVTSHMATAWLTVGVVVSFGIVLGLSATCGCSNRPEKEADSAMRPDFTNQASAPTPETWDRAAKHYLELRKGMKSSEVIAILGEPNEITPAYEAEHFRPRQVGRTFVYAKTKFIPPRESRDTWLRVDLDLQDRVECLRKEGLGDSLSPLEFRGQRIEEPTSGDGKSDTHNRGQ